ncbi:Tfx family DNA-binding protein [Halocalculus aciditolerans]|uniref:Transcriptional regulator n=1 Tax=Halocalculus aciditolerans TaxID=1383812 RepID=A0A830FF76_9EURY|nr:Tfx family DNA-binding protein [Halocalculus aciditolerans]GGL49235.1 transcriptional regulator [Halocalculus aciditolerans]
MSDLPDPAVLLDRVGFDASASVLTRRQAEVLVLRERGASQAAIASRLGTSRANVSKVESAARANVEKARETVAFANAVGAPVRVDVEPGADVFGVPERVYEACDDAGVKVARAAPELVAAIRDAGSEVVVDREVVRPVTVAVSADGAVEVRVGPV